MQSRPFILLSTLIFIVLASIHAFRLYRNVFLQLGSHVIPMAASWAGLAFAVLMAIWGITLLRR